MILVNDEGKESFVRTVRSHPGSREMTWQKRNPSISLVSRCAKKKNSICFHSSSLFKLNRKKNNREIKQQNFLYELLYRNTEQLRESDSKEEEEEKPHNDRHRNKKKRQRKFMCFDYCSNKDSSERERGKEGDLVQR